MTDMTDMTDIRHFGFFAWLKKTSLKHIRLVPLRFRSSVWAAGMALRPATSKWLSYALVGSELRSVEILLFHLLSFQPSLPLSY